MPRTERAYTTHRSTALAKLRVRAKLNRAAAAEKLGIAEKSLGNIERGVARASDELLARMAEAYDVSAIAVRRAYVATRREFIVRETP
jgi:transcriptional regulator with XRE-family HTH domain